MNFCCCCCCLVTKLCPTLLQCPTLCHPMDCSPPGSCVHGILQARILEWLPCSPPGDLPNPEIEPASLMSPALAGGFFTTSTTWEAPKEGTAAAAAKSLQSTS